jgi:hypothetical protein
MLEPPCAGDDDTTRSRTSPGLNRCRKKKKRFVRGVTRYAERRLRAGNVECTVLCAYPMVGVDCLRLVWTTPTVASQGSGQNRGLSYTVPRGRSARVGRGLSRWRTPHKRHPVICNRDWEDEGLSPRWERQDCPKELPKKVSERAADRFVTVVRACEPLFSFFDFCVLPPAIEAHPLCPPVGRRRGDVPLAH